MKLILNLPTPGIKYKLYWIITSVAYILGLVATFISLFLMNSAQPALLYLVSLMVIMMIFQDELSDTLDAWEENTKNEKMFPFEIERNSG